MASIFTRKAVGEIMSNADLDENQRTEQIMGLWGRALDDGYMAKSAAAQAQAQALESAKAEWEKGYKPPDPEQLKGIREKYEEYFTPADSGNNGGPKKTPQFSQQDTGKGTNPTSKEDEAYQAILKQWG